MPARSKLLFILLNVIGGIAVLGSYAYGFVHYPDSVQALWGDVPESLLGVYSGNMFLAAAGYLLVFAYLLSRQPADSRVDNGGLLFERLNWLFAVILFCSALWMPLSFALLEAPNQDLWWCIRAVLFGTGISALIVGQQLLRYGADRGPLFKVALGAYVFFCFQTAVLDALIWPYFFPI